jgi:PIN domain nuclease of toxin-antitoxin system
MYLDTHVIIWLYEGALDKFTATGKALLNTEELKIAPIIRLELQFLYEINKIKIKADKILDELYYQLGITTFNAEMPRIIHHAMDLSWTRDPFDRLIVATAACENALLLTKDNIIHQHYKLAVWD